MSDQPSNHDELPDDLPPLDGEEDDDQGVSDDMGLQELARTFDDQQTIDLDDPVAADLDIGVVLQSTISDEKDEEGSEVVLDIGRLLDTSGGDDEGSMVGDDEGPVGFDPSIGIDELPEADGAEDVEGAEEPLTYLVADELPSIDDDDDGDFEQDQPWELMDTARDEPPPDWAQTRWRERPLAEANAQGPCSAVLAGPGVIVAGGDELVWLADQVQSRTSRVRERLQV